MRKDIRHRHEANRRGQAICEQNRGVIETGDGGKKALSRVNASVDGVDALLADQEQARNDRRKALADLVTQRRTLHDLLQGVVDVSRYVTLDDGSKAAMALPRITTDEQLTAVANAIDRVATAKAAAFVAEGLPAGAIANLRVQIDRLVELRKTASTARKTFTASWRAARMLTTSGRAALKVIDAILAQSPNADPKELEKLRLARRIGYTRPSAPLDNARGALSNVEGQQPETPAPTPAEPGQTTPTKAA